MIYLTAYDSEAIDRTDKRQREHMLGRTLLKVGLQREYALFLPELAIGQGKYGKPYLEKYPEIHFNISHCDGLVVCAIHNQPIGVDAERIRPYSERLPGRVLSEAEQAVLEERAADGKPELFFRYWTLKESYIKATGTGLSVPLNEITGSQAGYTYYQTCLEDTYIIAVCVENPRG